ncbi:MAG: 1-deoxy-D-xylulose-5-phosphate reductoisomerase [Desulfohalobiaceae bacterium]
MPRYISPLTSPAFLDDTPRALTILGSTGSIGQSALKIVARHPDRFTLTGLAGATNAALLARQAARWRPPMLGVLDHQAGRDLAALLPAGYRPEILTGTAGYQAMASQPGTGIVLNAQVGAAGLPASLAAVRSGKVLALANKESLVLAGGLLRELCRSHKAVVLPVDSEHNAVFQALCGHDQTQLRKIILTASGGPFRGMAAKELRSVTPEQALAHPNWSMGAKISIDSATLMNKGLEFIEAHHLFGVSPEQIEVVVHPESIVHSLVEYCDGSLLAHLGVPDMQIPIAYCLSYPERLTLDLARLDLISLGRLSFETPDTTVFPCLDLARQALSAGPSYPVVLNAANEVAVERFLNREISFGDIPGLISRALEAHAPASELGYEAICDIDRATRLSLR